MKKNIKRKVSKKKKMLKKKKSFKIKGGANTDNKQWVPKSKDKCESFLEKLSYQSGLNSDPDNSNLTELYSIKNIEDNSDLDNLFQELYNCLPKDISERPLLPTLAMFPSTNYASNIDFSGDE